MAQSKMRLGLLALSLTFALMPLGDEAGSSVKEQNGLVARLELGPAMVGQLSKISWDLAERKSGRPVPARLTLAITHLEKGTRILFLDGVPTDGKFSFRFHFTDGAPYRITSVAEVNRGGRIKEEQQITVTGRDPPREAVYPSLFLFVLVIALGLVGGRISRRRASATSQAGNGV